MSLDHQLIERYDQCRKTGAAAVYNSRALENITLELVMLPAAYATVADILHEREQRIAFLEATLEFTSPRSR